MHALCTAGLLDAAEPAELVRWAEVGERLHLRQVKLQALRQLAVRALEHGERGERALAAARGLDASLMATVLGALVGMAKRMGSNGWYFVPAWHDLEPAPAGPPAAGDKRARDEEEYSSAEAR